MQDVLPDAGSELWRHAEEIALLGSCLRDLVVRKYAVEHGHCGSVVAQGLVGAGGIARGAIKGHFSWCCCGGLGDRKVCDVLDMLHAAAAALFHLGNLLG